MSGGPCTSRPTKPPTCTYIPHTCDLCIARTQNRQHTHPSNQSPKLCTSDVFVLPAILKKRLHRLFIRRQQTHRVPDTFSANNRKHSQGSHTSHKHHFDQHKPEISCAYKQPLFCNQFSATTNPLRNTYGLSPINPFATNTTRGLWGGGRGAGEDLFTHKSRHHTTTKNNPVLIHVHHVSEQSLGE